MKKATLNENQNLDLKIAALKLKFFQISLQIKRNYKNLIKGPAQVFHFLAPTFTFFKASALAASS